jgi:hypothetical protein
VGMMAVGFAIAFLLFLFGVLIKFGIWVWRWAIQ